MEGRALSRSRWQGAAVRPRPPPCRWDASALTSCVNFSSEQQPGVRSASPSSAHGVWPGTSPRAPRASGPSSVRRGDPAGLPVAGLLGGAR